MQKLAWTQNSSGCTIKTGLSSCTRVPIRELTLWEGLLYLMSRSKTDEGVLDVFAQTRNRTGEPRGKAKYTIHRVIASQLVTSEHLRKVPGIINIPAFYSAF